MLKPRNYRTVLSPLEEDILLLLLGNELYVGDMVRIFAEIDGREITDGSLYPTLRKLERGGYVEARWGSDDADNRFEARRRYYQVNQIGESILAALNDGRLKLQEYIHHGD